MAPNQLRLVAMAVFFAIGIPGMIVASINDNSGAVITFGLIAVIAAVALLAVNAVISPHLVGRHLTTFDARRPPVDRVHESEAKVLEDHVQQLVAAGADEDQVRDLVRRAVRMARLSRDRF